MVAAMVGHDRVFTHMPIDGTEEGTGKPPWGFLGSVVPSGGFMHRVGLVALCSLLVAGCPTSSPPAEARFPGELILALLDKDVEAASDTLVARYPGSTPIAGSFLRYEIAGSEVLDEVIMFRDVRSDRVNSVILKYRGDLTANDRRAVFTQSGHAELAGETRVREVEWGAGLTLRATPADRFGRLTLTVEP
jgi:hypothetical protein